MSLERGKVYRLAEGAEHGVAILDDEDMFVFLTWAGEIYRPGCAVCSRNWLLDIRTTVEGPLEAELVLGSSGDQQEDLR